MKPLLKRFHSKGAEYIDYLRPFISTKKPRNSFILFAQGRTGSWLLHDMLNTHPEIHFDKEILAQPVDFPFKYTKGQAHKYPNKLYGCHIQIRHFQENKTHPATFLTRFCKHGGHLIYLRRLNILRQSISSMIAVKRRMWHTTKKENLRHNLKTTIDLKELQIWLKKRELNRKAGLKALQGLPHLKLIYETDLLESHQHQATMDKIFNYLELSAIPVKTKMNRLSSNCLSDSVENYEELVRVINSTPYAEFLDTKIV